MGRPAAHCAGCAPVRSSASCSTTASRPMVGSWAARSSNRWRPWRGPRASCCRGRGLHAACSPAVWDRGCCSLERQRFNLDLRGPLQTDERRQRRCRLTARQRRPDFDRQPFEQALGILGHHLDVQERNVRDLQMRRMRPAPGRGSATAAAVRAPRGTEPGGGSSAISTPESAGLPPRCRRNNDDSGARSISGSRLTRRLLCTRSRCRPSRLISGKVSASPTIRRFSSMA